MKLVCITDQFEGSDHSSIEGIFGGYLQAHCDVQLVYFSRERREPYCDGRRLILPYRFKRHGAAGQIDRFVSLSSVDFVIVRNFFPVLRDVVRQRKGVGFRIGFWNSFPHTYRRLFEAEQERRAVLRKSVEYRVRSYFERRLVDRCDFLVTMSPEFQASFYPGLAIPHLALPMGIDFAGLPTYQPAGGGRKRLIYTGTVDSLRQTDLIAEALAGLDEDFALDIYTRSDNATTRKIAALGDRRITLCPPLPRPELFRKMAGYDAGIGLIPENRLYNVSSPTKTLEYYGIGMPAIVNYLPEYVALFDERSAFFCDFRKDAIQKAVRQVLAAPAHRLAKMGQRGREIVVNGRSYESLAQRLFRFLEGLQ